MSNRGPVSAVLAQSLTVAVSLCFSTPGHAQDRLFAGSWRIERADRAPWATPEEAQDAAEPKRLVGKTVTFGPKAVVGPAPLGCVKPVYSKRMDGPDMLFQGMLADPDRNGAPRDAMKLAKGLGVATAEIATLEVGCSQIEYHAFSSDELVFGLNNRVYRLRRPAAQGRTDRAKE
jgi:hypothetical protein